MRHIRADVFCYLIVAVLFLAPFSHADGGDVRLCLLDVAHDQCGPNQRCVKRSKDENPFCECLREYALSNGQCLQHTPPPVINATTAHQLESAGGSVAAGLLIPTFLIVVGVLLYLGARRYKWLQRFRLLRSNRHGDILVTRDDDDDDDDPPIGTRCAPV
ncbi:uncharacterized protein LOC143357349 [Halictus rubicundus]|uniref:uncharacterized protein LOC143357349 n=1 Tax=Halictus rubicundus TaxID=77578 RepID=UPI0040350C3C